MKTCFYETLSHTDVENDHTLFCGWFFLSGEPVYCMPGQQCHYKAGGGIHTNKSKKTTILFL